MTDLSRYSFDMLQERDAFILYRARHCPDVGSRHEAGAVEFLTKPVRRLGELPLSGCQPALGTDMG
jgi:hypothetical protein